MQGPIFVAWFVIRMQVYSYVVYIRKFGFFIAKFQQAVVVYKIPALMFAYMYCNCSNE